MWELSHFLIAERKFNAQQVREAVERWVALMSPVGHTGDACYEKRCNQPFEVGGCGRMDERQVL